MTYMTLLKNQRHSVDRNGIFLGMLVLIGTFLCTPSMAIARDDGRTVVVVYNKQMAESKDVADHYAKARSVPASQVIGLDLPTGESMSRVEFINLLQHPLHKALVDAKFFIPGDRGPTQPSLTDSTIRYAVLCYGVPLKVTNDPELKEKNMEKLPESMRRSGCAVDAQLALLPWADAAPWVGAIPNPGYGVTNHFYMHPTNGLLLVTRLDGPSAAIAKGLVDKSIEAETNGLCGRAYFDSRGITNGPYFLGDEWIRKSARVIRQLGFETTLDEQEAVFDLGFPMSHIALYAGWYSLNVWGPFILPKVEFVPGAFAYHLHSYSAETVRDGSSHWVGPLLAKGVTATMGCVDEPFLGATPAMPDFFGRFIFFGNSFGEAAYACQEYLSWQTTVVGDPLYTPFFRQTDELERDLTARSSPQEAWCNLMEANQNIALGADKNKAIKFLQQVPNRHSPVLQEKVANLLLEQKRYNLAAETFEDVLKKSDSPMQKLRVLFALGELRSSYGPDQKAYEAYDTILKTFPTYADKQLVYQKLIAVARRLGKKEDEQRLNRELAALPPKATPSTYK